MKFDLKKISNKSSARLATLRTDHGKISTPFFMPIATKGAVKNLDVFDLNQCGADVVLSNTYHQYLKPGAEILKNAGGFHKFINWKKPVLTDSGGFQIFSLAKIRKITHDGVEFSSNIDGGKHFISPEKSIEIQRIIGSDIMMVLDECPYGNCAYEYAKKSLDMTLAWANRCKQYLMETKPHYGHKQALFGIVQGGRFKKLRQRSVKGLVNICFDGYAIGGVSVGEKRALVKQVVEYTTPLLPEDKPRYLMGLGKPEEIVMAVRAGVDMFDCVIPTREARHGRLYYFCSPREKGHVKLFGQLAYKTILITNAKYKDDFSQINEFSQVKCLREYSRAYLRHLLDISEGLGFRLATMQNVEFYLQLMKNIRVAIAHDVL